MKKKKVNMIPKKEVNNLQELIHHKHLESIKIEKSWGGWWTFVIKLNIDNVTFSHNTCIDFNTEEEINKQAGIILNKINKWDE
jgi:hypothetical protein